MNYRPIAFALALLLSPFAAQAQVTSPCVPDPYAGTWPQVQFPNVFRRPDGTTYTAASAASGSDTLVFAATAKTVNPNGSDDLSGDNSWPWAWQEASGRFQAAWTLASVGFVFHHSPSGGVYAIDYKQLHDAIVLVATTPLRPGIPSGQTEYVPASVRPDGSVVRPALTVPVYTEDRYSPNWLPYPTNPTRYDRVRDRLHIVENAGFRQGWQDGFYYSPQSAVDKYTGWGFAPETLAAVEALWLPLPSAGRCVIP